MSTQEFKVGDRVVVTDDHSKRLTKGSQHVVSSVSGDRVMLEGMAGYYWARRFEKVEPEWVVGQQVKDGDYALLPVGAKVDDDITKTSTDGWTWVVDGVEWPNKEWFSPRTLTHLPDAPEPEDTDDVEPEPLKEAIKPAFNDNDVTHLKVMDGSSLIFDGLAVFEEAENGNITVTPVPRCTSLFEKAGSILRCGQHEGHADGHWTIGSTPAASWSDKRACGRLVESGGAS